MKGVVFTEFFEMVEKKFSPQVLDQIITQAQLSNGGAYTTVGTYDHADLVRLVQALAERSGLPVAALIEAFGEYLFARFHKRYPRFFEGVSGTFEFLSGIESVIHAEVLKLYPDAQLPRFHVEVHTAQELHLLYLSERHFADLAQGLIKGCIAHYGEPVSLRREDLPNPSGGAQVRFCLTMGAH